MSTFGTWAYGFLTGAIIAFTISIVIYAIASGWILQNKALRKLEAKLKEKNT